MSSWFNVEADVLAARCSREARKAGVVYSLPTATSRR